MPSRANVCNGWEADASGCERPPPGLAHGSKRLAHVLGEQQRLFPGREVRALVMRTVEDEVRVSGARPAFRRLVDFVPERTDSGRQRNTARIEETSLAVAHFPIEARRRHSRVGEPVECDVVEDIVAG